jgi:1-pyrroline-5-carboxylate dehydrogenase
VGEQLATQLAGRIVLEDGGYDWKILGPSPPTAPHEVDYVAWQCDQDAYACSGQKCSAQSICFAHADWTVCPRLAPPAARAAARRLASGGSRARRRRRAARARRRSGSSIS